ncbi:MAG TPA: hypothetical protein VN201_07140 [Roseateles sp.]|nr:hypothetical protein [Roseateles sp.]
MAALFFLLEDPGPDLRVEFGQVTEPPHGQEVAFDAFHAGLDDLSPFGQSSSKRRKP